MTVTHIRKPFQKVQIAKVEEAGGGSCHKLDRHLLQWPR